MRHSIYYRVGLRISVFLMLIIIMAAAAACSDNPEKPDTSQTEVTGIVTEAVQIEIPDTKESEESEMDAGDSRQEELNGFNIDEEHVYQTWESFGTSGCWWSQYVGGWDKPYGDDMIAVREKIAQYLFSRDNGIGLTCYRYNIGAGSADSMKGNIWQKPRRTHCFLTKSGEYNWQRDAKAVWMLNRAVELGVEEIVLFANSPPESLTINGLAHMTEGGSKSNLAEENYTAFADYCFDIAEHFIDEGYPVKYISPINEPQWDWYNGQEGCHYETDEMVAVLKRFVEELEGREKLKGVAITGPESGEWKGNTTGYIRSIMEDEVLGKYFSAVDCHSYWSSAVNKEVIRLWLDTNYPELALRTSEWCEMVNGKDYTMDSAFNMADVIVEDITILNVVSWQNWVAVADGDYRDGLIYVNTEKKACRAAKRLWGYGNYTRYIRPGYVRVDIKTDTEELQKLTPVAFTGINDEGQEELVMVFINRGAACEFSLTVPEDSSYTSYSVHTTSEQYDLEETQAAKFTNEIPIVIDGEAIVTIVLK